MIGGKKDRFEVTMTNMGYRDLEDDVTSPKDLNRSNQRNRCPDGV